jgi:hypothetical protein
MPVAQTNRQEGPMNLNCKPVHGRRLKERTSESKKCLQHTGQESSCPQWIRSHLENLDGRKPHDSAGCGNSFSHSETNSFQDEPDRTTVTSSGWSCAEN